MSRARAPPPLQIIFYSLNYYIGFLIFKVVDAGGSMIIHSA